MYVVQRHFRLVRRGYDPDEVDRHLQIVSEWFSHGRAGDETRELERALAAREQAVQEREQDAERLLASRREEAEQLLESQRVEAEATIEGARLRANADLDTAQREAHERPGARGR